jgi:hypothetical protein
MSQERKQIILNAINIELGRQDGKIDSLVLATAIDAALGGDTLEAGSRSVNTAGKPGAGSSPKGGYAGADEGKTPDELNAANDE